MDTALIVSKYIALLLTVVTGLLGTIYNFEKKKKTSKLDSMNRWGKLNLAILLASAVVVIGVQILSDVNDAVGRAEEKGRQAEVVRSLQAIQYPVPETLTLGASINIYFPENGFDEKSISESETLGSVWRRAVKRWSNLERVGLEISIESKQGPITLRVNADWAISRKLAWLTLVDYRFGRIRALCVDLIDLPVKIEGRPLLRSQLDLQGCPISVKTTLHGADSSPKPHVELSYVSIHDPKTFRYFSTDHLRRVSDTSYAGVVPRYLESPFKPLR